MANHGKNARVYVSGRNLTSCFREADPTFTRDVADSSVFGTNDKEYVAGMKYGGIRLEGLYKGDSDEVDAVMREALATDGTKQVLYAPNGVAVGAQVVVLESLADSYSIGSAINNIVHVAASFQACDGGMQVGTILVSPEV